MLVTRQPVLRRFWYALFPVTDLDDGPKPFTLLGEHIVVWKKSDGSPAAARDRCCHRTARLSKGWVEGDHIVCGYHGWQYDCSGACVKIPQLGTEHKIPAGARITAYHCQARYGYVWVALDDPLRDIPDFPEDGQPGYRRIFQLYETWRSTPMRLMENSFDNSHFSFVHKGTFGDLDNPLPSTYDIEETDYGFEARQSVSILNPPQAHDVTGSTEARVTRHMVNRYYLPFCRRMGVSYDSGIDHMVYNCATPIDDERMVLVQWLYRNDTEQDCSTQKLIDWDTRVTREDKDILEATDHDVCMDTRRKEEFHMPSDKPGLIIRKQILALLAEHGEQEVFRSALPPIVAAPARHTQEA
ncbi:aromatic ring-hydroxylating dioxygenase subunit alpha [Hydrogenophaga flava]|uniref:aromatic ring-hydroxylating dioxygenase subunit alpha n=1 Tax=Hydrogenophaga flava TaxID=65657 RepID=UPI0008245739|nr:aromatic ring-hydroxylating dioxygenase subunit alpha [Hydrogenophaga flava]